MPFSAGDLCCANTACVLLDTSTGTSAVWDKIPHVTQIAFNMQSNTPKLVTSSTDGKETSICGTVSQNGNLAIACHEGAGPQVFTVNSIYHIRWASDCSKIWNKSTCTPITTPTSHYEAYVRITQMGLDLNLSASQAIINNFAFDIVSWVKGPDDYKQPSEADVDEGFTC